MREPLAGLRSRNGSRTCPCCHDDLRDDVAAHEVATCADCEITVHVECVELTKGCPTLGCGGDLLVPPETRVQRARRAVDQIANVVGVFALALLVTAAVFGVATAMAIRFLEALL